MKTNLLLYGALLCTVVTHSQIVNIPDLVFKNKVLETGLDTNLDGEIQVTEAAAYTDGFFFDVTSSAPQTIHDLTGIEAFVNITTLNLRGHDLTSLNITNNTQLTSLALENNELTSLDLSNNDLLTHIDVNFNNLTALDISSCPALIDVGCQDNEIVTLNVGNNTALKRLWCQDNNITALDVTSCIALEDLECSRNELTQLNITANIALKALGCSDNNLASLNVTPHTQLFILKCNNNSLMQLDVHNNILLQTLQCRNTQISNLNISNNPSLIELDCYENMLTALDVTGAPNLYKLNCGNNLISSIDLTNNTALEIVELASNQLSTIDVSMNTQLRMFSVTENSNLIYINLKNGNNDDMFTNDYSLQYLPVLEKVCVDDLESDFAEYVALAVGHPIELVDVCATMGLSGKETDSFNVYPNPVKDILHVKSAVEISKITVYNNLGQMVATAHNQDFVNLSGLCDGIYTITFIDVNGKIATKKVIK